MRRLALAALLVFAVALVGIPCWIALHRDDLPAVDDHGLVVERSSIAPEDDGYVRFARAAELADWPDGTDERLKAIRSAPAIDSPADREWIRDLVARNAAALEALDRGISAPAFQLPEEHEASLEPLVDVLLEVQRLLKLAGAEARLRLEEEGSRAGIGRASLGLEAGRRLAGGEGLGLTGMMFAVSFRAVALYDLEALAREAPLPRAEAEALIIQLEAARFRASDWTRMWAAEYQRLGQVLHEAEGDVRGVDGLEGSWLLRVLPRDYLWQTNRTLSGLADVYRERQRRSGLHCRAAVAAVEDRKRGRDLRIARALVSPNPVGRLLLEIATPNFDRFDQKRCHIEARISLVQAWVAVRLYQAEHGRLPADLGALVPEYLEQVPVDGFVDAPLRYSAARRAVWSVGDDFVDAGGGEDPEPGDAAEPALAL